MTFQISIMFHHVKCNLVFDYLIMMLLLPAGKVLIIGGGIANFTNVAATFKVV